ncbi:hypothetical protein PF005_g11024 [Phytophthora fragariae]|uniref:Uncharacterized protein n=1 Tax=Phytophthora fragariae TaxID=53985 RepID=A0A6A3Y0F6_9STRA|nr:hypothetical protein PF005_g11024 [Phytophthora fragariae]
MVAGRAPLPRARFMLAGLRTTAATSGAADHGNCCHTYLRCAPYTYRCAVPTWSSRQGDHNDDRRRASGRSRRPASSWCTPPHGSEHLHRGPCTYRATAPPSRSHQLCSAYHLRG